MASCPPLRAAAGRLAVIPGLKSSPTTSGLLPLLLSATAARRRRLLRWRRLARGSLVLVLLGWGDRVWRGWGYEAAHGPPGQRDVVRRVLLQMMRLLLVLRLLLLLLVRMRVRHSGGIGQSLILLSRVVLLLVLGLRRPPVHRHRR